MSDPQLVTIMQAQFAELRGEMRQGFVAIRDEMRVQNGRVSKGENRLTVIETERAIEARTALRRSTWAGIIAGALVSGLIKAVDFFSPR